ncbi:hypothetical protein BOX15_Mlig014498g1, partial [Macrostomum lignano]
LALMRPWVPILPLLLQLARVRAQCNPASSVPDPRVGVVDYPGTAGDSCYFPFTYGGRVFHECDGPYCDGSFCGYWCATSCNYPTDYSAWRFCRFMVADLAKPNCAALANMSSSTEIEVYGSSGLGTACYFPFMHDNVCYDDCIDTDGSGQFWCSTTDVMYHVATNKRFCRATRKGLRDSSCSRLNATAPVYLPQQIGNYSIALVQTDPTGNCTFPFYYKEKCYDDCTTVDAQAWDLPWCLTEKYYQPNKRTRVCPHYRKYKEVTGLALDWGFFYIREHTSCSSGGAACNSSWSPAGSAVPTTSAGSKRMALQPSAEPIEVMPQPNGLFILKLPLSCTDSNWRSLSIDGSEVGLEPISNEREFWDLRPTGTPGAFTVQSMRNSTRGMYLSHSSLSGTPVLSLSATSATQWRFEALSDLSMASLGLPCENPTRLDGSWCAWSEYFVSGSVSTRNRTCACPPAIRGLPCDGNSTEVASVVNGSWCGWSAWTEISDGYNTRSRLCNCSAPKNGGADCPGAGNETGLRVNGSWCDWSAFTVDPDGWGFRSRYCNCSAPQYGGLDCVGPSNDTGVAVNGSWCAWSSFSPADSSGLSSRTRVCNCSASQYGGSECVGASNETGPQVNGSWCNWSPFNVTHGQGTRRKSCNCRAPQFGGAACPGSSIETGPAVNGTWCSWSPFTVSGSLGVRTRACNCSAPQYGGSNCSGLGREEGPAVNGTWCAWSAYSSNGTHETRRRVCNCSAPQFGGSDCPGRGVEASSIVSGGWCSWSAWSVSGTGRSSRNRSCTCPSASRLGAGCSGPDTETESGGGGGSSGRAHPAEPGEPGAAFTSLDSYTRLVAWSAVICLAMLTSTLTGLGLMLNRIVQSRRSVGSSTEAS